MWSTFAHSLIAIQKSLKGIGKLILNEQAINRDLENCWNVVAEGIQTILRKNYRKPPNIKELTRTNNIVNEHLFMNLLKLLHWKR